jgi:hypothetical protein
MKIESETCIQISDNHLAPGIGKWLSFSQLLGLFVTLP